MHVLKPERRLQLTRLAGLQLVQPLLAVSAGLNPLIFNYPSGRIMDRRAGDIFLRIRGLLIFLLSSDSCRPR